MAKKHLPGKGQSKRVKKPLPRATGQKMLIWVLGIHLLLFLHTRILLLAIPLERDEGSFAYIGHWLFRGKELYTEMIDSKLPGLYIIYGLFTNLFGYNAIGVHLGLLMANLASILCFYFLIKELFSSFLATLATVLFMWMAVSPNMVGTAAHATQLLTPFVLGGVWLFFLGLRKGQNSLFLVAGLMIGIAFTIKQQAAIFGVLIALWWWPARLRWMRHQVKSVPITEWLLLGVGGLFPVVLVFGYYFLTGKFDSFYTWTVKQPMLLASKFIDPWYVLFSKMFPLVIENFLLIWVAAAVGIVMMFFTTFKLYAKIFGLAFSLVGMASVMIGVAYYKHYFVLALPGIALLNAVVIYFLASRFKRHRELWGMGLTVVLLGICMAPKWKYYFAPDYAEIHYQQYTRNMFPEIEKLGEELRKRVPEGQRIAVVGSEPEVLVAAQREGVSKYLMMYALCIDPERGPAMQQDFIAELKAASTEYLVLVVGTASWVNGFDNLPFFNEILRWVETEYQLVGLAESRDQKPGVIVWEEAINTFQSQSNYQVFVMRRLPHLRGG